MILEQLENLKEKTDLLIKDYLSAKDDLEALGRENKALEQRRSALVEYEKRLGSDSLDLKRDKASYLKEKEETEALLLSVRVREETVRKKEEIITNRLKEMNAQEAELSLKEKEIAKGEAKVKQVDQISAELDSRGKDLDIWESLLRREKEVSRLRKEELDIREKQVAEREISLQRRLTV